jgi:hypothetical protein
MNRREFEASVARVSRARDELEAATEELADRCAFDRDTHALVEALKQAPWTTVDDEYSGEGEGPSREAYEVFLKLLPDGEDEYWFRIVRDDDGSWSARDMNDWFTQEGCDSVGDAKAAVPGLILKTRRRYEKRLANIYKWNLEETLPPKGEEEP